MNASPSLTVVEPGEEVSIDAVMSLSQPGLKTATVSLDLNASAKVILDLRAVAVESRAFRAAQARIELGLKGDPVLVTLISTDLDSSEQPPVPGITTTDGFSAEFMGWKKVTDCHPDQGIAARWDAAVVVIREKDELAPKAAVIFSLPSRRDVVVPVLAH